MPTTPDQRSRWLRPLTGTVGDQAVVKLFELDLGNIPSAFTGIAGPIIRWHAMERGGTVIFNGNQYDPWPVNAEGFEYNTKGPLPRPSLSVSNIGSIVSAICREYQDCVGAILRMRQTYAAYLTTPAGSEPANKEFLPMVFVVQRKVAETNTLCAFDLSAPFDSEGILLPRRQVLATACSWIYRSPECSYGAPAAGGSGWPVVNRLGNPFGVSFNNGQVLTNPNDNNLQTLFRSTTANFFGAGLTNDVGKTLTGTGLATGTKIVQIYDSQNVKISPANPLGSGITFTINRLMGRASGGADSLPLAWSATTTYNLNDVAYVALANGIRIYAVSKQNSNLNKSIYNESWWWIDWCLKKQSDCEWHFGPANPLPYGGFPAANKLQ